MGINIVCFLDTFSLSVSGLSCSQLLQANCNMEYLDNRFPVTRDIISRTLILFSTPNRYRLVFAFFLFFFSVLLLKTSHLETRVDSIRNVSLIRKMQPRYT